MTPARAESIPFSDYRAAEGINGSWLKAMGISPLHFQAYTKRKDDPTEPQTDGRHIHTCCLELALYEATTCTWEGGVTKDGKPTKSKNSTAFKEYRAAMESQGKEVLSGYKDWLYRRIRSAVHEHQPARDLVTSAQAELSVFWTHPIGLEMKSRLDLLGSNFVADLKTAADITPEGFGRAAHRYGYGVQGALYQDAAQALTGSKLPYYIIAVEKCEPFDVAVYELGDDILAMGRSQYCDNLRKVKACRESGEWPGIAPSVQSLEFPPWAYTDDDDVLDFSGMEATE